MISLTDRAAEELKQVLERKNAPAGHGLRLSVRRGGCAGWQYVMDFGPPGAGDEVIEHQGVRLIVAADSTALLGGSEVDFSDELSDRGFRVHNPNSARSCGCGTSFEAPAPDGGPAPESRPDGTACGEP